MAKQEISIERKGAVPIKFIVNAITVNELRQIFSRTGGNLFSGKYNIHDFAEFTTNEELNGFFLKAQKFTKWKELSERVSEYPNLIYLFLYATFLRKSDTPAILASEASWIYKDVYNNFSDPAYLVGSDAYDKYINGNEFLGRPKVLATGMKSSELFVTSNNAINKVLSDVIACQNFNEQCQVFSKYLGFDEKYLKNVTGLYKIKLKKEDLGASLKNGKSLARQFSRYMPKGNESGANECWIAGGKTLGGLPEIVLEGIPNSPNYVSEVLYLAKMNGKFNGPVKKVNHQYGYVDA